MQNVQRGIKFRKFENAKNCRFRAEFYVDKEFQIRKVRTPKARKNSGRKLRGIGTNSWKFKMKNMPLKWQIFLNFQRSWTNKILKKRRF